MVRSDLCGFSEAYIVVEGNIIVSNSDGTKRTKAVAFKSNAPFIKWI